MRHLKMLLAIVFTALWVTALLSTCESKTPQDPKPPPPVISEEISVPASAETLPIVSELNLAEIYQLIEEYYQNHSFQVIVLN